MTFDETVWTAHFAKFEGCINHFYLDGAGLVTVGIGCVVRDPSGTPMFRKADSVRASHAEIISEYGAVKALPSNKPASFYDKVCKLYLPESEIRKMFSLRLMGFLKELHSSFPLSTVPESAALALTDMAFNLGVNGLYSKFPRFCNAFKARDWHTCAMECRRNGIQADRNAWTKETFEALERAA